ncbi:hypothetical protein CSUI_003677 [Cystoisospora suis]|uniref:Uncharacterized protein n=1 Tax=Cystoisospora suis TaxID=483139 RepID=A0A2C6L466_9APIC|nr:hypothetical protein CSUI_003677 [Cystoisospora suis]
MRCAPGGPPRSTQNKDLAVSSVSRQERAEDQEKCSHSALFPEQRWDDECQQSSGADSVLRHINVGFTQPRGRRKICQDASADPPDSCPSGKGGAAVSVNPYGKSPAMHIGVRLPSGRELEASFHQSCHLRVAKEVQTGKLPHGLRGMTFLPKPHFPFKDAGLLGKPLRYRISSQVAVADPVEGSQINVLPHEQLSGKGICWSPNREEEVHAHSPQDCLEDADHNNLCGAGSCTGTLSQQAIGQRRLPRSQGMTNSETEGHADTPHSAAPEMSNNSGLEEGDDPQSVADIELKSSTLPPTSSIRSGAEGGPGSLSECASSQPSSSNSSVHGTDRQKRIRSLLTMEAAEGTTDTLRVVQLRRRKRLHRSECIRPYSLLASAQVPNRISDSQLVRQTDPSRGFSLPHTAPQSDCDSHIPNSVLHSFSGVGCRSRSDGEAGPAGKEQQPPPLQLDTQALLTGDLQRQRRESLSSAANPRGSSNTHSSPSLVFGLSDKQQPAHLGESKARRYDEDSERNSTRAMVQEPRGSLESLDKRRDDHETSEEEVADLRDEEVNEGGAEANNECARNFIREKAEVNPGGLSLVTVDFRRAFSTPHSSGEDTRAAIKLCQDKGAGVAEGILSSGRFRHPVTALVSSARDDRRTTGCNTEIFRDAVTTTQADIAEGRNSKLLDVSVLVRARTGDRAPESTSVPGRVPRTTKCLKRSTGVGRLGADRFRRAVSAARSSALFGQVAFRAVLRELAATPWPPSAYAQGRRNSTGILELQESKRGSRGASLLSTQGSREEDINGVGLTRGPPCKLSRGVRSGCGQRLSNLPQERGSSERPELYRSDGNDSAVNGRVRDAEDVQMGLKLLSAGDSQRLSSSRPLAHAPVLRYLRKRCGSQLALLRVNRAGHAQGGGVILVGDLYDCASLCKLSAAGAVCRQAGRSVRLVVTTDAWRGVQKLVGSRSEDGLSRQLSASWSEDMGGNLNEAGGNRPGDQVGWWMSVTLVVVKPRLVLLERSRAGWGRRGEAVQKGNVESDSLVLHCGIVPLVQASRL